jgi:hypothetical protein
MIEFGSLLKNETFVHAGMIYNVRVEIDLCEFGSAMSTDGNMLRFHRYDMVRRA